MAATAYSKFRLFFGSNGGNYVSVSEFRLYGSADGSGSNLFTGGTPSASSFYNSSTQASAAFDGNSNTTWESSINSVVGGYLRYDLAAPVIPRSFYIACTIYPAEAPKIIDFQGSNDGTNWTTIQSFTDIFSDAPSKIKIQGLNLYLGGVALQSDGNAVNEVRIYNWTTGDLVLKTTPANNGNWGVYLTSTGDYAVMYKGASGFRPIVDGPIQPLWVN